MSETIGKYIGEGHGKGEVYAALAYDEGDTFGGMKIKGISFSPVAGKPALNQGDSTTAWTALYTDKFISMYATCASTDTGTSFEPVLFNTILTGAGQVGGRVRVNLDTDVTLGGWANAFKASVDLNNSGGTTGLLSAICAEMTMATGNISGTYALLELEMTYQDSGSGNLPKPCYIYAQSNGTQRTVFDDYGKFLILGAGHSAASGHILSANSHTLKCGFGALGATLRYMLFSDAEDTLTWGTMTNAVGTGVTLTDSFNKPIGLFFDATADGVLVGAAAHELYGGEVRQLLTGSPYQGEQYAWKATQRYYGTNSLSSYSAALHGKLEYRDTITCTGWIGCVQAFISDGGSGAAVIPGFLYGFNAMCRFSSAHTGSGYSAAYMVTYTDTYNWDIGLYIPTGTCDIGVAVGNSTTAAAFTVAAQRALSVYTTTNYTGSASCGSYLETAMTGVGGAGVGTEVYLKTSVALGNYVAAFYAVLDLQTAGGVTGVGSAICGELVMPGGAAGIGTFGVLKLDIVCSTSWTSSQRVALIRTNTSGGTAAKWITEGYIFDFNGLGTPVDDTSAVFHLQNHVTTTHALRILVDGVAYDIPLVASTYTSN